MPRKKAVKRVTAAHPIPAMIPDDFAGDSAVGGEEETEPLLFPEQQWKNDPTARVRLQREDVGSKKWVLHGYLACDEATEDEVARLFGGGRYMVTLVHNHPASGKLSFLSTKRFSLPGVYRVPMGNLPGFGPQGSPASPEVGTVSPGMPSAFSRIPAGMSAKDFMDNALLGKVLDLLETKSAPAAGMSPVLSGILVAVGPALIELVRDLMLKKPSGADPAMMMLVEQLQAQVKELRTQPGPATTGITDVFKSMRMMTEMQDMMGGNKPAGEGESGMWGVLGKVAEVAQQVMAGRGMVPPTGDPSQPPAGELPPAVFVPGVPIWEGLLQEYSHRLIDAASSAANPETVADLLLQFMPREKMGALTELMRLPDTEAQIVRVVPAMQQYPTWLQDMVKTMRETMFAPDEEDDEERDK